MTAQAFSHTIGNDIESRIGELITRHCSPTDRSLSGLDCELLYDEVVRQACVSSEGGKRLRARLLLAFYDVLTARNPDDVARGGALDLACAIEVFQTAALVHDDIIDEADVRRGKPSAHKALASLAAARYAGSTERSAAALGSGLGIMLGDLLATASVDIVNEATSILPNYERIMSGFLTMHREVEIGQVLDLAAEHLSLDDPDELAKNSLAVFRWKTASYTTIAPIRLALLAAGVDERNASDTAEAIGVPLGLAFQLADDLLDVISNPEVTGKPVGGDIREGKRTVLLADALSDADHEQADYLKRAFTAPARDAATVDRVIALFSGTGAVSRSKERIASLWRQTQNALDDARSTLDLDDADLAALHDVCSRFIPADIRD
ncbi:polyprenyl synthetase family protein [Bifidobacterium vansinderenii]|uniref:Bifunctional short chain isoprenyl diphosphate synthase n=1 Tax=Bifidobacterium vansinderenii TaxID=1984871 RepID=A0A229VV94_9BIFI|nr:polyprenyl synthetase family protein [Bifidobacterium vansinderenii]OXM99544.1 bifunctional short chain isoprenyl diphosphate synthase [Bifidobacterium vansinderenii]